MAEPSGAAITRRAQILDVSAEVLAVQGIRTPLRDLAAANGILPGSLYHHFESKEQLLVALVRRYVDELEQLAAPRHAAPPDPLDAACELAMGIADCASRHRAALLLTFYEPPSVYGRELTELAARAPIATAAALVELLSAARGQGRIRADLDPRTLAVRIGQSMLHIGVGRFHQTLTGRGFAAMKLRVLLDGIAPGGPGDDDLDRSAARAAADAAIAAWPAPSGGRHGELVQVARDEFGRRGYENTTMRDIAGAAGLSLPALYRIARSKDALLATIMAPYTEAMTASWTAVARAPGTAIERIDALVWLGIQLVRRFDHEQKVEATARQLVAPGGPNFVDSFPAQLSDIHAVLADAGDIAALPRDPMAAAMALYSLIWTPVEIVDQAGPVGALRLARATLIRGAAA